MREHLSAPFLTLALGLLIATAALAEDELCVEPPPATSQSEPIPCDGAGPQAPRDVDRAMGSNPTTFAQAPPFQQMQLCDIHFHRLAEHRATGYPDSPGAEEGYYCKGHGPPARGDGSGAGDGCGGVQLGDTVEVHWVFTTCDVEPAPTLDSCFSPICANPQLRVEAGVFYLTDGDPGELDFGAFAQASDVALPAAGDAVAYLGSTTGPSFDNESSCSPFQVTWNVRPTCRPLRKATLDAWCEDNVFCEKAAHGVRELVTPLTLRARID